MNVEQPIGLMALAAVAVLGLGAVGLYLALGQSRDALAPEMMQTIAMRTGGKIESVADQRSVFRFRGEGESPWLLEGFPARGKSGGNTSSQRGGSIHFQAPTAGVGKNWIALFNPRPPGNIPMDHPLVRTLLRTLLGEELGEPLARANTLTVGNALDQAFVVMAHDEAGARGILDGPVRMPLEQWAKRGAGLEIMMILDGQGVTLRAKGLVKDPDLLAAMVTLGVGVARALTND